MTKRRWSLFLVVQTLGLVERRTSAYLAEHLTWFRDPSRLLPASVYVA